LGIHHGEPAIRMGAVPLGPLPLATTIEVCGQPLKRMREVESEFLVNAFADDHGTLIATQAKASTTNFRLKKLKAA
jgi:hypothetical protein